MRKMVYFQVIIYRPRPRRQGVYTFLGERSRFVSTLLELVTSSSWLDSSGTQLIYTVHLPCVGMACKTRSEVQEVLFLIMALLLTLNLSLCPGC